MYHAKNSGLIEFAFAQNLDAEHLMHTMSSRLKILCG